MMSATVPAPADPTLATLVPRPSPWRNVALVAVAFAALVIVPVLAKPSIVPGSTGGGSTAFPESRQVVTQLLVEGAGPLPVTVVAVDDVPGATVVGAWLLPPDAMSAGASGALPDGAAYVAAVDLGDARAALPPRLPAGERAALTVVWQITDCAALTIDDAPEVVLRTVVGTTSREELPDWAGPGAALQPDGTGVCPAV